MTAPLIGLIGKKRTGKDTFAGTLTERHAYARIALADPLREAAYALNPIVGTFPLTVDDTLRVEEWRYADVIDAIGYEKAKDYVPEIRRILQRLGTESIRAIDDKFWIKAAFAKIDALREAGTPVVVTDVRYPNEADAIKEAGGYLIRISRNLPSDGDGHASEKALDDYKTDLVIHNNGSLWDLAYYAYAVGRDLELMQTVRNA
ncbi:deoxynucleoside monophosphate kinase [Arthrobacter phage Reedo]|uniref:Deoxynucleoside monophosphate kinase n=1 Tax=Arthrobacter phage Reedo TaxID=2910755 RepID=A0AA49GZN6_9CAUD|nr:deoxynucleoside monophosphate kinase [Arthrobacter phage Reedo]UJQ86814.1 deoxynucleoside monophosphate kinase [Arthrobacter phage Reedo]